MGSALVLVVLFLGAAGIASWAARRQASRAQAVALAPEVPVAQLEQDCRSVAQELGAGSFRQVVRIRGKIVCDRPLMSELSQTPCVSYRFSVTRESEEVLWEVDRQGQRGQRVQRRTEVLASNEASTSFELDDGTGRIPVYPAHARIETIKTYANFQPVPVPGVHRGSIVLNLGSGSGGTLGYRYEEQALPVGHEVTVIAEAGDAGGQLALRGPENRETPFLVSLESPAGLARRSHWQVSILRGVSIGLAAVAVLIFLLGVVR